MNKFFLKKYGKQPSPHLVGPQRCRVGVQRAVVVWFPEEGLYGEEDGPHFVQGAPLLLEDVQADVAVLVHVGVVAGGGEADGRGRVRVAGGEVKLQLVLEAGVNRVLKIERLERISIQTSHRSSLRETKNAFTHIIFPFTLHFLLLTCGPSTVATHVSILSPSGNAEMPRSPPIIRDISSC